MSVKVVCVPLRLLNLQHPHSRQGAITHGSNLQLGDLGQIFPVVYAIAKYVAKVAKSPLQSIGSTLFFSFFERCSFPLAILNVTIPHILYSCKPTGPVNMLVDIIACLMKGTIS